MFRSMFVPLPRAQQQQHILHKNIKSGVFFRAKVLPSFFSFKRQPLVRETEFPAKVENIQMRTEKMAEALMIDNSRRKKKEETEKFPLLLLFLPSQCYLFPHQAVDRLAVFLSFSDFSLFQKRKERENKSFMLFSSLSLSLSTQRAARHRS